MPYMSAGLDGQYFGKKQNQQELWLSTHWPSFEPSPCEPFLPNHLLMNYLPLKPPYWKIKDLYSIGKTWHNSNSPPQPSKVQIPHSPGSVDSQVDQHKSILSVTSPSFHVKFWWV